MNLNKAFILGNVTRDPEVRAMPNGNQVTNFSIATNRRYTANSGEKREEVEFHNIVCFGKLADISARYLNKGSLVLIEGRIKTRNWVNTAGVKQYKTEIIADTLQLGPKGAGTGSSPRPAAFEKASLSPRSEQGGAGAQEGRDQGQDLPMQTGDIPIIEENYTPSLNESADDQKTVSLEDSKADEIDIKDIPF